MISFDKFVEWAEKSLGPIKVVGSEVKVNSIFTSDSKFKMWCSPSGGKNGYKNGVYHCWKTGNKGSLINLVMTVDKCTYEEAVDTLGGTYISFHELEKKVNELFDYDTQPVMEIPKSESLDLEFPPFTFPIQSLSESNYFRTESELYLAARKIPIGNLCVCTQGNYRNRIVIPYYNAYDNLIYYNCRSLDKNEKSKYLGPPKDIGVGKSDILYFPVWPEAKSRVYLTEGEFDAMAIFSCEFYSASLGGKELSEKQIGLLLDHQYIPVFSLDNDAAGMQAKQKINEFFHSIAGPFYPAYYVVPPKQVKDWNEFLIQTSPNIMKAYIEKNIKLLNDESFTKNNILLSPN
jgi:hypothetical protein